MTTVYSGYDSHDGDQDYNGNGMNVFYAGADFWITPSVVTYIEYGSTNITALGESDVNDDSVALGLRVYF